MNEWKFKSKTCNSSSMNFDRKFMFREKFSKGIRYAKSFSIKWLLLVLNFNHSSQNFMNRREEIKSCWSKNVNFNLKSFFVSFSVLIEWLFATCSLEVFHSVQARGKVIFENFIWKFFLSAKSVNFWFDFNLMVCRFPTCIINEWLF